MNDLKGFSNHKSLKTLQIQCQGKEINVISPPAYYVKNESKYELLCFICILFFLLI
jgi:hypothetical protein